MSELTHAESDRHMQETIEECERRSKKDLATFSLAGTTNDRFHATIPKNNNSSRAICKVARANGFVAVDVWSLQRDDENDLVNIAFERLDDVIDEYEPADDIVAFSAIREIESLSSLHGDITAGMVDKVLSARLPAYNVNPRVCDIALKHGYQLVRVYKPLMNDRDVTLQFRP